MTSSQVAQQTEAIKMQNTSSITTAIAWCLAWGDQRQPQFDLSVLQQMRQALNDGVDKDLPEEVQLLVEEVKQLQAIPKDYFPEKITELQDKYLDLWKKTTQIGLVYGGATKIKQYVFEASKLPDIRGASGLLDQINLIDLPAFFGQEPPQCRENPNASLSQKATEYYEEVRDWLNEESNFPNLSVALIPELIIYSTGGNILTFCPAAFVNDLANAIEKRYTYRTLTANSCAVGKTFKLLEIRFGLLQDSIEETLWLDWYRENYERPLVQAYFGCPKNEEKILQAFKNRKSFNELAGSLASLFNQRRNGNDIGDSRPLRRYPPMFETHPYLKRDGGDRRSAIYQAPEELPGNPWFSEALLRKRLVSEMAKEGKLPNWYLTSKLENWEWKPGAVESWVSKFKQFLYHNPHRYYENIRSEGIEIWKVDEAKSVREIANASNPEGFVAYIYADGNNMGGFIQKIKTPEEYKKFSEDIFKATEEAVYEALAQHLQPHKLNNLTDPDNKNRNGTWIHPFEIITIGGDDVFLIVPADKALAIAHTIGEEFEKQLLKPDTKERYSYKENYNPELIHRYKASEPPSGKGQCKLSMSIGVLITAEETPIYYAEKLTNQLLKSAKKRAKELKNYLGGTVDFLVMKSVTMISSNISEFRTEGLTKTRPKQPKLKLYGSPYTLHELDGLLKTAKALKDSHFPRSQIYQIRSFLEQGKHTAMLNYRYFRVRLNSDEQQKLLQIYFEEAWCQPKNPNNKGNLAPWMTLKEDESNDEEQEKMTYETIWRELVDLYPFIEESKTTSTIHTAQKQR